MLVGLVWCCPYNDDMSMNLADMETVSVRPRSQLLRLSIERNAALELGIVLLDIAVCGGLLGSFGARHIGKNKYSHSLRELKFFP